MALHFKDHPGIDTALADLEILRKSIASKKLQGWAAIAFGIVLFFVVTSLGQLEIGLVLLAIGIIPGAVILYQISEKVADYKYRFKKDIIGAALCTIDPSLSIEPEYGIPADEFRTTQLFTTTPDRYFTEDLVSGKIEKTMFYFAEVHAEYRTETQTKNGRRTEWHDIFKGILFTADFNKHFNGITIIRPKNLGNRIGSWFSKKIFNFGDKDIIDLENEYFNANFVTYGTDQIEARYILTPSLMEKIAALNERSSASVSVSFVNSNMYIAFPLGRNYFEPPTFKSLLNPEALESDMNVLNFMCDIVHEMDLNTRIWTKN